jgi:hypothetical protein
VSNFDCSRHLMKRSLTLLQCESITNAAARRGAEVGSNLVPFVGIKIIGCFIAAGELDHIFS